MFNWLAANIGTVIIAAIILAAVVLITVKLVKDKKGDKGGCGCGCANCPSAGICHTKK